MGEPGFRAALPRAGERPHKDVRAGPAAPGKRRRLYDPLLGRMLSADPIVQEPHNAQNLNRYSYVVNNPLSYTDPSGLSFWKKYGRQMIAIGVSWFLPNAIWFANLFGSASTAVAGFISGAVSTGNIRGAIMGAFTAGMGGKFTAAFGNIGGIVARGIVGGISEVLQGGKFGHGFASAGIGAAAGPHVGRIANDYVRAAAEIIVGGTASVAAGGKFANGAVTAAMRTAVAGWASRVQPSGSDSDGEEEPDPRTIVNGIRWPNNGWRDNITVTSNDGVTYIDLNLTVSYDPDLSVDYVDNTIAEIGSTWSVSHLPVVGERFVMRTSLTRIDSGIGDLHLNFWRDADVQNFARSQVGGPNMHLTRRDRIRTRAHEFGHNLGFRHWHNFTGSITSYSANRSVTYQDLKHVARAYGSW